MCENHEVIDQFFSFGWWISIREMIFLIIMLCIAIGMIQDEFHVHGYQVHCYIGNIVHCHMHLVFSLE